MVALLVGLACPAAPRALDASGPLPWGKKAVSSHAPYAAGDCSGCHSKRSDGYPGELLEAGDTGCLACHDDAQRHKHAPRKCVGCHNAHDSMRKKLLRADMDSCSECHDKK
jgi:predicted CXXCH cytochrome family protein